MDAPHHEQPVAGGGHPAPQAVNPAEAGAHAQQAQGQHADEAAQRQRERDERGARQIAEEQDAAHNAHQQREQQRNQQRQAEQRAQQNVNVRDNEAIAGNIEGNPAAEIRARNEIQNNVLGRLLNRRLMERTAPGLTGQEIREPGKLRRFFCRIPLLGALIPGHFQLSTIQNALSLAKDAKSAAIAANAAGIAGGGPGVAAAVAAAELTTLESAKVVAQGVVGGTLPTMAIAAAFGGVFRGVVDGIRYATGQKVAHNLARIMTREGTGYGKSMDRKALWGIVFGKGRGDIAQLADLSRELQGTAGQVMINQEAAKRLIRTAVALQLDKETMLRMLGPETRAKFTPTERLQFEQIDQAYNVANQLLQRNFTAMERMQFAERELPAYLNRREYTNIALALPARMAITGFKTSLVAGAASIIRGLFAGGLVKDALGNAGTVINTGVKETLDRVPEAVEAAKLGVERTLEDLGPEFTKTGTKVLTKLGISIPAPAVP